MYQFSLPKSMSKLTTLKHSTLTSTRLLTSCCQAHRLYNDSRSSKYDWNRLLRRASSVQQEIPQQVEEEITPAEPAPVLVDDDEIELEELDEAQEQLINWMLTTDNEQQDEDLDEMLDYDQLGDDEYEEMHEAVEEMYEKFEYDFKEGDKVIGTVIDVDEDGASIDIGAKASGFVPLTECSFAKLKTPLEVLRVGMTREFMVVENEDAYGQVILSLGATEAGVYWQRIKQLQEEDVTVSVVIESANKGGLLVRYGPYEGFIPVSQLGPSMSADLLDTYVGVEIPAKFLEVDEEQERLVFSNKRASSVTSSDIKGYQIGDVVLGTVQTLKPYGAFIDIGNNIAGLLHVSQISHERIVSVEKVLREGDKIKVMILSQDRERGRVTLSTKKLEENPGDMLKNPQLVFDKAEEMAQLFRQRVMEAEAAAGEGALVEGVGAAYPL